MGFVCHECGKRHDGLPMAYRADVPSVTSSDRPKFERDGELCLIGDDRFILANLDLPVAGSPGENFILTCWVSLSEASYERMQRLWDDPNRADQEPAFGWLSTAIPTYDPTTFALKMYVHTRDLGQRPWLELEPTDHPLAREQREGISRDRIAAIYHAYETSA
jgi:hypothetical protein